jgi:hypothetical protein
MKLFSCRIWRLDYKREQFLQKHFSTRPNFLLDFDRIRTEHGGPLKNVIIIKKGGSSGFKGEERRWITSDLHDV